MKKTKTWLPVFSGFYGTIWEDWTDINYDIKEYINEKEISKEEKDIIQDIIMEEIHTTKEYYEAIEDRKINICKYITKYIEKELKEEKLLKSIEFQNLRSPKFYNYENDSINCEIKFTKENVKNIKKIIKENYDLWTKYLKDNFKSRDGFISHWDYMPNSEDWENISDCMDCSFRCGAVLNFICIVLEIDEFKIYECCEYIYLCLDFERVENELRENMPENFPDIPEELRRERLLDKCKEQLRLF